MDFVGTQKLATVENSSDSVYNSPRNKKVKSGKKGLYNGKHNQLISLTIKPLLQQLQSAHR